VLKTRPRTESSQVPDPYSGGALHQRVVGIPSQSLHKGTILPDTSPDVFARLAGDVVMFIETKRHSAPAWDLIDLGSFWEGSLRDDLGTVLRRIPPNVYVTVGEILDWESYVRPRRPRTTLAVEEDVVFRTPLPRRRVTVTIRQRRRPPATLSLSDEEWDRLAD